MNKWTTFLDIKTDKKELAFFYKKKKKTLLERLKVGISKVKVHAVLCSFGETTLKLGL